MRTVLKTVIRSVSASASAASSVMSRESQLRVDFNQNRSMKDLVSPENLNLIPIQNVADGLKNNSLSPSYKLNFSEESSFEDLLDKECDYYPDNSGRGDIRVLNNKIEHVMPLEKNVNSDNVMVSLKNIRFINSIIFNESPIVFLIAANYMQRLLHKKAVKKDLLPFIATAIYDLALEHRTSKALTNDQISSLLSVSNIPLNHIEDFSRIKQLLLSRLNNDLQFIVITDYLQVLLKFNLDQTGNLPSSHAQLIEIACVLATSCELTYFTLACQAISLINLAARHVSLNKSFVTEFSDVINSFPLVFVSPVRLNQFASVANVNDCGIEQCTELIIRYYAKYYSRKPSLSVITSSPHRRQNAARKAQSMNGDRPLLLSTVIEESPILIQKQQQQHRCQQKQNHLNISELIEKLNKVSSVTNSHTIISGKQKKRNKKIKKNLSRQLRKYGTDQLTTTTTVTVATTKLQQHHQQQHSVRHCVYDTVDDVDSAISSSSNMTSPSTSPLTF